MDNIWKSNTFWQNIITNEGSIFSTVRGLPFIYEIDGNNIKPIRKGEWVKRKIPKSDFEKVIPLLPLSGPGKINNIVQGPAYVYCIDSR